MKMDLYRETLSLEPQRKMYTLQVITHTNLLGYTTSLLEADCYKVVSQQRYNRGLQILFIVFNLAPNESRIYASEIYIFTASFVIQFINSRPIILSADK